MKDLHDRREQIIKILMSSGKCTMQQLADSLQVSVRTIKRDIDVLGYKYPLCTENHRNGGVYISDYGVIAPPKLSEREIELIRKVVSQSEQTGYCRLEQSEIEELKKLVAVHSWKRGGL